MGGGCWLDPETLGYYKSTAAGTAELAYTVPTGYKVQLFRILVGSTAATIDVEVYADTGGTTYDNTTRVAGFKAGFVANEQQVIDLGGLVLPAGTNIAIKAGDTNARFSIIGRKKPT